MNPSPASDAVRGERVYRALLALYPADFRARYSDDLVAFYRDRVRAEESVGDRGPRRVWRLWPFWLRVLIDLMVSAAAERARVVRGASSSDRLRHLPSAPREDSMAVALNDVRYALRGMRQHAGFTAVIVATLALGIGANAAIFSVVNAVLLRPLPYAHVERIVDFAQQPPYFSVSEPEFIDYQKGIPAFARLAGFNTSTVTIGVNGESTRGVGARVSRHFFPIVGSAPALGRLFAADEYSPLSKTPIAVISHAFWTQQFGSDPRVVGRTMQVGATSVTIVGIMPAGFALPTAHTMFWTPWRLNPDSLWTRNNHYLRLIGQLSPGATVSEARAQAQTLASRWLRAFPETYAAGQPPVPEITPLRDMLLGPTRPYLIALLGAVGFILLIACVNVANLLLVRGESRRKEFAIRAALGASRRRMVRQLLTESMLYAGCGALFGVGVAWLGARSLIMLAPADVPRLDEIGVDLRVVGFTVAITLATGALFGLAPIARMAADSADTLRGGGKTSAWAGSAIARQALVVIEVALAVVMLCGSGLLVRSLLNLQSIDLGFDPSNVMTMQLSVPPQGYTDTTAEALFRQIVSRVAALPGVRSAALDGALPLAGGDNRWSIMVDGRILSTIAASPSARPEQITADFFATMSIPLVKGRAFTDADRLGAPPVAVINSTMARQLWPNLNPVGRTLKMFGTESPWTTIVGVVGDTKSNGIQEPVAPTMYFPYAQSGTSAYAQPRTVGLVVRTTGDPSRIVPAVRSVIRAADARIPVADVATMNQVVGHSVASRRFATVLLGGFAVLALALAGLGIYGVTAYGVSQRTYEIGVRMALGASQGSVLRLVLGEGGRMTGVGLAIGVGGASLVMRSMRALLVGVGPMDIPTFAVVTIALALVATCACAVPARRASAVSPTEALRNG